jgi:putative ABC transport system permease protein
MSPEPRAPPRLARRILLALTPADLADAIDGDLLEGFRARVPDRGLLRARLWYWRQLISPDILALWRERRPSLPPPRPRMLGQDLLHDVRYAVRSLARQPTFAAIALVTLAVGIGATTAVFSMVNGVLLRPLPYPDADRLVMVFRTVPRFGFNRSTASFPDFADWRDGGARVARLAAYSSARLTSQAPEGAERWSGYSATANLGPVLGVPAALGRWFTDAEDRPGAPLVIVLSHGLWQARFGGDVGIVGRSVVLSGEAHTVVGVMPPGFDFPSDAAQFWLPLRGDPGVMERDGNFLTVIGRLRDQITVARARAELTALAARIDAEAPGANQGYGLFVESRHAFVVRNARHALYVFLGAVALVLLIACANVANLLLARGAWRARELAIRAAVGAGRGRLARLLLAESAVLGLAGGALGVGVALLLLRALVTLGTGQVPRIDDVRLDATVLGFAAAISLACALVFGLVGTLATGRGDVTRGLRAGSTYGASVSRIGRRLQRSFVVVQVAVAVTLSLGAGLLVKSFVRLTATEPGFDPAHVVAARIAPRGATRFELMERVLDQTAATPGVETAALAYDLPFGEHGFSSGAVPEGRTEGEAEAPAIAGNVVAGAYFEVLRIPLLRGRGFEAGDAVGSPPVAVVNETLARAFWPGADPVGRRMRMGGSDEPWTTVVGVVGDVRQRSLAEAPASTYYVPLAQSQWVDGMFVIVRSETPAAGVVGALRRVVGELEPSLPVTDVAVSTELVSRSVRAPRFRALVLAVFGVAAVLVAVAGVYGVIAYSVSARRRELGIRVALGAAPRGLVGQVVRDGMWLAAGGVALGIGGALGLSRFLRGFLFGVGPLDPATFATVAAALAAVATVACYVPARRAAAADPLETMRAE